MASTNPNASHPTVPIVRLRLFIPRAPAISLSMRNDQLPRTVVVKQPQEEIKMASDNKQSGQQGGQQGSGQQDQQKMGQQSGQQQKQGGQQGSGGQSNPNDDQSQTGQSGQNKSGQNNQR